jgi:hypothetical protein
MDETVEWGMLCSRKGSMGNSSFKPRWLGDNITRNSIETKDGDMPCIQFPHVRHHLPGMGPVQYQACFDSMPSLLFPEHKLEYFHS